MKLADIREREAVDVPLQVCVCVCDSFYKANGCSTTAEAESISPVVPLRPVAHQRGDNYADER